MSTAELKRTASQVRRDIVRMVHAQQSGHPGGSLGCTDFLTALYFKVLKHDPAFNMDGKGEDLFFLSNGHISPVFYSVLARSGYFDIGDGDQMLFMKRFIPDFKNQVNDLTVHLLLRAYPSATASPSSLDPYIVSPTTQKVDTRARGRQIALRIESDEIDSNWRFGTLRVDIQPDGLR